jgi:hypothetical protein
MGVTRNNKLKFQKLVEHHPFLKKGPHVKAFSSRSFFMKDDVKVKVREGTPKILIPLDEVVN